MDSVRLEKTFKSINFFDFISIVFNKWLIIILITSLFTLIGFFLKINKEDTFTNTYKLNSISMLDKIPYKSLNETGFIYIDTDQLIDETYEFIISNNIFEDQLSKFGLLKREDYLSTNDYILALSKLTKSHFKLLKPLTDRDIADILESERRLNYAVVISGDVKNYEKLFSIFQNTWDLAESDLKNYYVLKFNENIRNYENNNSIRKELIELKISNLLADYKSKLLNKKLQVEFNIENEIKNYQISIKRYLFFLSEQAQIAKALGIIKNSVPLFEIEEDPFLSISNDDLDYKSYYLRGTEAIAEEIKNIRNRVDDKDYIKLLLIHENELRSINNDLLSIENNLVPNEIYDDLNVLLTELRAINQDNSVKIAMEEISRTPLGINNDFYTGTYVIDKYQTLGNIKFIILSILYGLLISIVFILLNELYKKYKLTSS